MGGLKKLGSEVVETMKSSTASNLLATYAEVGIDALLDDGVLKEVPLVGTVIALAKVGGNISDSLLLRKLARFLKSISEIDAAERQAMIERLEADPKYGRKVGEQLLELLDRIESHEKPEIVAKVFVAYSKGKIDSIMLQRLNLAIERLPSFDISCVRIFHDWPEKELLSLDQIIAQTAVAAGLAEVASGYDGLLYIPNEVCKAFIELNLDSASAESETEVTSVEK